MWISLPIVQLIRRNSISRSFSVAKVIRQESLMRLRI
jgi:hypothetical protein